MKKTLVTSLALLLCMALIFSFAACKDKNEPAGLTDPETEASTLPEYPTDEPTTEAPTTEEPTTEAPTETVTEVPVSDPTSAPGTSVDPTSATATVSSSATETTTETVKVPKTKAEIVEYFNAASNKVKTDKPGFTWKERLLIDEKNVWVDSGALDALAPTLIKLTKNLYSNWTDKNGAEKGGNHNNYPSPGKDWSSKLTPDMVKSATITDKGATYEIKLTLNNETVKELPKDRATTNHGKAMDVWETSQIMDGMVNYEKYISMNQFTQNFIGSTITVTVDKALGRVTKANYTQVMMIDLNVKVIMLGTHDAKVPMTKEAEYIVAK